MDRIYWTYDEETDTIYIQFSQNKVRRLDNINEKVRVHYSEDDNIVGIEFFNTKGGIKVSGLPYEELLRKKLKHRGSLVLD